MEIDQQLEQWINIKFLVKLGKNCPEIHQMLQQVYVVWPKGKKCFQVGPAFSGRL